MTSSRRRMFWSLQAVGWLGLTVLTYLTLTVWYTTGDFLENNLHTLVQSVVGMLLVLLLRKVFLALWDRPVVGRMALSFVAVLAVALAWTIIRMQLYLWIVVGGVINPLENSEGMLDKASIFFNFGSPNGVNGEKVYYWDDVSFGSGGERSSSISAKANGDKALRQIDLPVTFDDNNVDYTLTDFGGTYTVFGTDPTGRMGTVAKTTKPAAAESWAGTTISGGSGLASPIPISVAHSFMSVWVYSPEAGARVRLKLEDHNDPNVAIETEAIVTEANVWERLEFDFNTAEQIIPEFYSQIWREFGGWYYASLLIFLCWSALYYGIKYALLLQTERDEATHQARRAQLLSLQASEAAKEAQLQMLRYQLNPHFLFNTLNAIYALVKFGDNESANLMLVKISKFLRYSLDSDPNQLVSLSQELDALQLYLEIEQVRFDQRLKFKADIEPSAGLCLVPGLILQPLVENSIKYAVAGQENGGTILIEAVVENDQLVLTVSDDGPGLELADGKLPSLSGIGLSNTLLRLETLFGDEQSFVLEEVKPHGLRIIMRLPYKKR